MGLIQIYCGDGKGKTTASTGLVLRAIGHGKKVVFCQFFKDGSSGEINSLAKFDNLIYLKSSTNLPRFKKMNDEQKQSASKIYTNLFMEAVSLAKNCEILVLDEIISAYNYGFFNDIDILKMLKEACKSCEVVLTGRNPSKELSEIADYVSEFSKVKHPFDKRIPARNGIEY